MRKAKDDGVLAIRCLPTNGPVKRYVLMDRQEKFWTGDGWTAELAESLVFEDILGAHGAWQTIMLARFQRKPLRVFEARIRIEFYADDSYSPEDLRAYLEASTHFCQDVDRGGNGPGDDTLVLQRADYSRLREVT
jgi:hypothetical protein